VPGTQEACTGGNRCDCEPLALTDKQCSNMVALQCEQVSESPGRLARTWILGLQLKKPESGPPNLHF
jgi:hypothetical protein